MTALSYTFGKKVLYGAVTACAVHMKPLTSSNRSLLRQAQRQRVYASGRHCGAPQNRKR